MMSMVSLVEVLDFTRTEKLYSFWVVYSKFMPMDTARLALTTKLPLICQQKMCRNALPLFSNSLMSTMSIHVSLAFSITS